MADNTTQSQSRITSAKDKLAGLGAKKVKKAEEAKSRPSLELPPDVKRSFVRFIEADAIAELAETRMKQERSNLDEGVFKEWTDDLWRAKNRPANPSLEVKKNGVVDISAIYQVQERFKLHKPEVPDGKTLPEVLIESFIALFVGTGLPVAEAESDASRLVNDEIDFTPKKTIDLTRLVMGHYEGEGKNRTWVDPTEEEQALANKVINLLSARRMQDVAPTDLLTDEEGENVVEERDSAIVKKGFLQRVCTYARSLEQLRKIFSIIEPVTVVSSKKFAQADSEAEQNRRKLAVTADMLGVNLPGFTR